MTQSQQLLIKTAIDDLQLQFDWFNKQNYEARLFYWNDRVKDFGYFFLWSGNVIFVENNKP